MKICDMCEQKVTELRVVNLLNEKKEFYKKDSCNKCYDSLPDNYLKTWFTFYPFARCINTELTKKSLDASIFWSNFPSFRDLGNISYQNEGDTCLDRASEKSKKDRKKIKSIHILKREEVLKQELNHIECDFEYKKDYEINKLIDGDLNKYIWNYGWSGSDDAKYRFDLLNYQVRYQIIFHLYLDENIKVLKELIFKELSLVKNKVVKMVDYIELKDLNKYHQLAIHDKIGIEIRNLDKRHDKMFNSAINKICKRK